LSPYGKYRFETYKEPRATVPPSATLPVEWRRRQAELSAQPVQKPRGHLKGQQASEKIDTRITQGEILSFVRNMWRLFHGSRGESILDTPPSLANPVSQLCTQAQFDDPAYAFWCEKIGERPRFHRKQWEYCYILQALATNGVLAPESRGIGYGVGKEPLPAVMASYGCHVLATDQDAEAASTTGWTDTSQYSLTKNELNSRNLCDGPMFERLVELRVVDMNRIPDDLRGYDFTWSACALEHLGSLSHGLAFIEASLATLRPGGIAVHTTEFNCSSNHETLETQGLSIYRERDIVDLARRLKRQGHQITLNLHRGDLPLDRHIDVPPYSSEKHLKLMVEGYVTTSIGLLIRKRPH